MMPMRPVIVRRWEVFIAFMFLLASYVVGLILVTHSINQNRKAIQEIREFRTQRAEEVNKTTTILCKQDHDTITILHLFLQEGTIEFQLRPVTGLDAKLLARFVIKTNQLLNRADCNPNKLPTLGAIK